MKPDLSIIIVNWNGELFLPSCLRSIAEYPPGVPYELIVVDNASSDASPQWLASGEVRSLFPAGCFRLIQSDENLGFGRANNLAIRQVDSPFVFLLNPDTVIKPNAIDKLLDAIVSSEKVGAVAPKLLNADGSLQWSVWAFPPTPLYLLVNGLKIYKVLPTSWIRDWLYSIHWDYSRRGPVPAFSGAAILAKREMIDEVGAFDEEIHMYGEDAEWCVRINRMGWTTVFEPDAEIIHVGGQSALQRWGSGETRLKEEEAFISIQRKCLPRHTFVLNQIIRLMISVLNYLANLLRGREASGLEASIRLQWRSIME